MGGLIVGASGSPAPRRCCIHCAGAERHLNGCAVKKAAAQ